MFNSMDLELRKEFLPAMERLAEKYSLPDIVFISFTMKHGYRNKYCATDVIYALLAILEHVMKFCYFNTFLLVHFRVCPMVWRILPLIFNYFSMRNRFQYI